MRHDLRKRTEERDIEKALANEMKRMLKKNKNWRTKFEDNADSGITTTFQGGELNYQKTEELPDFIPQVLKTRIRRVKSDGTVNSDDGGSIVSSPRETSTEKKVEI